MLSISDHWHGHALTDTHSPNPILSCCHTERSAQAAKDKSSAVAPSARTDADVDILCDSTGMICVLPDTELVPVDVVCDSTGMVCVIPEPTGLDYWKPRITILGCCALYGTNFAFGKMLGAELDPSLTSALRFSLAALTLSPYLRQVLTTTDLLPSVQPHRLAFAPSLSSPSPRPLLSLSP
jgi:hypothetical protein